MIYTKSSRGSRSQDDTYTTFMAKKTSGTFVRTKYDKIEPLDEPIKFSYKVQFTHESEINNTLLFLDCLIEIKNERRFQTNVYRITTQTGEHMHCTPKHPKRAKVSTIKTLVRRAKIVCSSEESLTDELSYIRKTMQLNG